MTEKEAAAYWKTAIRGEGDEKEGQVTDYLECPLRLNCILPTAVLHRIAKKEQLAREMSRLHATIQDSIELWLANIQLEYGKPT